MITDVIEECKKRILQYFPERQIYLRSGGEVRYYVFGTKLQLGISSGIALAALWCALTITSVFLGRNPLSFPTKEAQKSDAKYERLLEESRAQVDSANLMLSQQRENFDRFAKKMEEKHSTISKILETSGQTPDFQPITGAGYAKEKVLMSPTVRNAIPRQPRRSLVKKSANAADALPVKGALRDIDHKQNYILEAAETTTLQRIERNRSILQSTDLSIEQILDGGAFGKGGPFIGVGEQNTPQDGQHFGSRIASIKARVAEAEALDNAVLSVPFSHPVRDETYKTSSYGLRTDPITKRPAMHRGIDFGGRKLAPIVATAPGRVTYVGRNGTYGRMVEIDHGHGFKTRYAHLAKTYVKRGQILSTGEKIGGMGSTGRSTATHLHYEIMFQGRRFDPDKFLKAGNYVQQN